MPTSGDDSGDYVLGVASARTLLKAGLSDDVVLRALRDQLGMSDESAAEAVRIASEEEAD